ncbi:hypothetical protein WR25_08899 [Diploscapter pachys]|uniref:beta-N-acetylhexosaminidase n=1 Tax=Diploscapter pachys TaxID=2018661 RepID=A0A2A2JBM8_9BILA|nr:hypothetical protein WR25_08899 [Diploscapter pachys]
MSLIRVLRRRAMGYIIKGAIIVCFVIFLVNITSSYPKGSPLILQHQIDPPFAQPQNQEHHEDQPEPQKLVDKAQPRKIEPILGQDDVHNPESETQALQQPVNKNPAVDTKYESVQLKTPRTEDEKLATQLKYTAQAPATKANRKGAFYENIFVHFDLKGAPPRISYFVNLLKLVANSGATGILLEWEEMFPWKGKLEQFKSTDAYNNEEVKEILDTAKNLGLTIVPLVQTFGHLEWILKFEEMRKYRENDAYPQVICLGDDEGLEYVREALRQVIEVHKDYGLPFFHIGADEAFEFGVCEKSRAWIRQNASEGGKQTLALNHLKVTAEFVKSLTGQETTVLAWHDMLKDFQSQLIKKLKLGTLVEPVVWDYSENIVTMPDYSFSVLAENFPTIWASSAYKGANFPGAKYIDIRHYETNNRAWVTTKSTQQRKFSKFQGIIITGWQRYDHLAGLCEILPMGTPSMVLQVQIALQAPNLDMNAYRAAAARVLQCERDAFSVNQLNLINNRCGFHGFTVYSYFQGHIKGLWARLEEELEGNHHIQGWGSRYSRRHNVTQNWYISSIMSTVDSLLAQADSAENQLREHMKPLFFDNTIDEFLFLTTRPFSDRLRALKQDMERLRGLRTFPKRHFPISKDPTEL